MSEISKEERKEYMKAYHAKNKEKIAEQRKAYRQQNKEKIAKQKKAYDERYRQQNKEKISEYNRVYQQQNKEKIAKSRKKYIQTEKGKKNGRICNWKHKGIISEDYHALYEKYINTSHCEECGVELTVDKIRTSTTRCLDHDHTTGLFRNVVCHACNVKRG